MYPWRRCLYVIEEKQQVLKAVEALKHNDLTAMGTLIYQTHEWLSKLYEVSCPKLDFLVEFSKTHPQVLGARMMGGGFGGCTLNLIHEETIKAFTSAASMAYYEKFERKTQPFCSLTERRNHFTLISPFIYSYEPISYYFKRFA